MKAVQVGRLPLVALLAGLAAALDFTVRTSSAAWTVSAIPTIAVFLSPTIYLALFTLLLLKLSALPSRLPPPTIRWVALALCVCSIAILVQIFTRGRDVGSASYSEVLPLFVSGVPLAALTFVVFFRTARGPVASTIVAALTVLWVVMPIGMDTMYVAQGGYRGPVGPSQLVVLGTIYDMITWTAALAMFPSLLLAAPATILSGLFFAVRAPRWEKLYSIALALSFLALSMQLVNWGSFVWD